MPSAVAIINAACRHKTELDLESLLRDALSARNLDPVIDVVEPADLTARLEQPDIADADRLISVGGDGTLRSVAAAAIRADRPLAIIPMGTMNLLAKDVGVPLDLEEAIEVAAGDETIAIDAGLANDEYFLHSSVLGVVPRLGRWRERIRRAESLPDTAVELTRAMRVLTDAEPDRLTVSHDGEQTHVSTFALAVAVGQVAALPPEPLKRPVLDAGRLAMYVAHHEGGGGLAQLLAEVGSGLWGIDARIDDAVTTRLTVHGAPRPDGGHRRILVSNDGETRRFDSPLVYSIVPRALRVHVP